MKKSLVAAASAAIVICSLVFSAAAQTAQDGQAAQAPSKNPFADWAPPRFDPPPKPSSAANTAIQDPSAVNAPTLKPSSVYVYESIDLSKKEVTESSEQTILSVIGDRAQIQEVTKVGQKRTRTLDLASHSLLWSHFQGVYAYVKFPASVGDTWDWTASQAEGGGSGVRVTLNMSAKFVGWEDITVPAGTFKAAKIHHTGNWSRSDGPYSGGMEIDCWYSPEVGRLAKQSFIWYGSRGGINSNFQISLVNYKPAPDMSNPFAEPTQTK